MMKITRKSMLSGVEHTKELDCTQAQFDAWQKGGLLIQNAFPNLSDDDREFILTGSTAEEWDSLKEPEEYNAVIIKSANPPLEWVINDIVFDNEDYDLVVDFKSSLLNAFKDILRAGFNVDPEEAGLTVTLLCEAPPQNKAIDNDTKSTSRIALYNYGDSSVGIFGSNYSITNVGNVCDSKDEFLNSVIPKLRDAFECIDPDFLYIDIYADGASEFPVIYSHKTIQSRVKP